MTNFKRKKFTEKVTVEVIDGKFDSHNYTLDVEEDVLVFQIKFSGLINLLSILTLDTKLKTIDLGIDRISPSPKLSKMVTNNYKTFIKELTQQKKKKSPLNKYKALEKQLSKIKDQMENLEETDRDVESYVTEKQNERVADAFRNNPGPTDSHPADGC